MELAKSFVSHYYTLFDSGKTGIQQLQNLYKAQSMLTWERTEVQGAQNIVTTLTDMPFEKVQHNVTAIHAQPTLFGADHAFVISVNGQLKIDDGEAMQFSQVWLIVKEGDSFWIHNDIFSLNFA